MAGPQSARATPATSIFCYRTSGRVLTQAEAFLVLIADTDPAVSARGLFWKLGSRAEDSQLDTTGRILDDFGGAGARIVVNAANKPSFASDVRIYNVQLISGQRAVRIDGNATTISNPAASGSWSTSPLYGKSSPSSGSFYGHTFLFLAFSTVRTTEQRAAIMADLVKYKSPRP
jgi:hypothetical protein